MVFRRTRRRKKWRGGATIDYHNPDDLLRYITYLKTLLKEAEKKIDITIFECCLCQESGIKLECGHFLCQECRNGIIRSPALEKQCPVCREPFNLTSEENEAKSAAEESKRRNCKMMGCEEQVEFWAGEEETLCPSHRAIYDMSMGTMGGRRTRKKYKKNKKNKRARRQSRKR
jgi:hypothetical protein